MRDVKNHTRLRRGHRTILSAARHSLDDGRVRARKRARLLKRVGLLMTVGLVGWWSMANDPELDGGAEPVLADASAELVTSEAIRPERERAEPPEPETKPAQEPSVATEPVIAQAPSVPAKPQPSVELPAKARPALEPEAKPALAVKPEPKPVAVEKAVGVDLETLAPKLAGTDRELALKMHRLFNDYDVPEAGVVVLDVETGKVLAEVGHQNGQSDRAAANEARWPGASIFKIVTASALLKAGVSPSDKWCFDGGFRRLTLRDVKAKSGGTCSTLNTAFARSYNVPFGRWADRRLSTKTLGEQAAHWGFGSGTPLGMRAGAAQRATLPSDRLEFAQAAAGFGDIKISALHGAMMASIIASGGVATEPRYDDTTKAVRQRILPIARAKALQTMMVKTVTSGSARRAFREHGRSVMRKDGAGGKTGSLSVKGRDLSWFVGFAPADNPKVAVGAYVANHPTWRIRATYVGREAMRSALYGTSPYRPTSASR